MTFIESLRMSTILIAHACMATGIVLVFLGSCAGMWNCLQELHWNLRTGDHSDTIKNVGGLILTIFSGVLTLASGIWWSSTFIIKP